MNILITSVGRRTQLIKSFKKELEGKGKLIVTDMSLLAPAIYFADKHYLVPSIQAPNYIETLLHICQKEEITAILSLIDPELSLLAAHRDAFEAIGTTPIVSPFEICELWLDKFATRNFCVAHGFNFAKTYNTFESFELALAAREIDFPVFIKPQKGSASLNINRAKNWIEAKTIFDAAPEMIIQAFMDGQELGVDVYIDLISKKVISIFIKEKIAMRAGETDKSKSVKPAPLFQLVEDLVLKAGLIGPIDIDIFQVGGEYFVSEINPRFGGGNVHAFGCGISFPHFLCNNLAGIENAPQIGNYEADIYMMKHDTVMITTVQKPT